MPIAPTCRHKVPIDRCPEHVKAFEPADDLVFEPVLRHRLLQPANGPVHPVFESDEIYPSAPFANDLDRYLWHRMSTRQHALSAPEIQIAGA